MLWLVGLVLSATLGGVHPGVTPPRVRNGNDVGQLLRLAGGTSDAAAGAAGATPVIIRVRTREGLKRATLPSADATLEDLEAALRREHRLKVAPGELSRKDGGVEPLVEADATRSLRDLGIAHGAILHLSEAASAPSRAAKSTSTTATSRTRRRRHTSMATFEAERGGPARSRRRHAPSALPSFLSPPSLPSSPD